MTSLKMAITKGLKQVSTLPKGKTFLHPKYPKRIFVKTEDKIDKGETSSFDIISGYYFDFICTDKVQSVKITE